MSLYEPTGGGTGTLLIDLVPDQKPKPVNETLDIMISVCPDEKDGVKIEGTDSITVEVPLADARRCGEGVKNIS